MKRPVILALLILAGACGPAARGNDDTPGDDSAPPDAHPLCTPSGVEGQGTCNDGFDNDCNGFVDCEDIACSDLDGCPLIGSDCEVTTPSVSFPLPDGNCTGFPPAPGAPDAEMEAFLATCGGYDGLMDLSGFPAGARLTNPAQFLGVCVKMEHSWLRDMQMEMSCPDGNRVLLSKFKGQDCPNPLASCEVFLGAPNEADEGGAPIPGTGWDYCWKTSAVNPPMIDFENLDGSPHDLPAGDYQPSEPFSQLADCNLNGEWKIRIVDGWGIDNGFVFETKLLFDGSLSDDCPIIE